MPKVKTVYRCTECGAAHARWGGRCDSCGEWNTLVEEVAAPASPRPARANGRRLPGGAGLGAGGRVAAAPPLRQVSGAESERWRTGLGEFDFVLGGGVVPGSMVLLGGEPGAGKSTLDRKSTRLNSSHVKISY